MAIPSTNPLEVIYIQDPSIVSRNIAGEAILVPIRQNVADLESIYLLNATAQFAWERFDGKTSLADICTAMTAEFEVSEDEARQDLLELVDHLERVGAVKRV